MALGLHAAPMVWGVLAACAECFGGWCLILGLFVRPAAAMALTIGVATIMHLTRDDGLSVASHAIEDGIVFLSFVAISPGAYSMQRLLSRRGR